jgi:hypothetical protein
MLKRLLRRALEALIHKHLRTPQERLVHEAAAQVEARFGLGDSEHERKQLAHQRLAAMCQRLAAAK